MPLMPENCTESRRQINRTAPGENVIILPLHLACDELTAIVRFLNSHIRAVSIQRPYDSVRFLGVLGSP